MGGHRGASAIAPENTYAAFEAAIAEGAVYTETDIRSTSDGHLVLVHDANLDRTTNGAGPVSSMTLAQVRELDAGAWFGEAFGGQPVPELPDFLTWIEARAPFGAALEVKASGIGARVAELAWASAARDHLAIYAFDGREISAAKRAVPDLPCVLLLYLNDDPDAVIARIEACGANGADVPWQWAARGLLAGMRDRGMIVGGGSADGAQAARELVELGVDMIDTDGPGAMLAAVRDVVAGAGS
ncbi:MAG: glycerophosphodiester phosphodiesterase [Candidatus Limnocylindrales bacterium]